MAKTKSSDTVETDVTAAAEPDSGAGAVGKLLRDAREAKKLELRSVADSLRIRRAHLEALEEGRHDRLPGATYAVGFIRTYADYLGLDGNEMARRFKDETAIEPENAELDFPTPVNEGGIPSAALLLVAVVLGAAVYGVWYWNTTADRPLTEIIDDVPERVRDMLAQTPDTSSDAGQTGEAAPDTVAAQATSPTAPEDAVEAPAVADAPASDPAPEPVLAQEEPAGTAESAPIEAPQDSPSAMPEEDTAADDPDAQRAAADADATAPAPDVDVVEEAPEAPAAPEEPPAVADVPTPRPDAPAEGGAQVAEAAVDDAAQDAAPITEAGVEEEAADGGADAVEPAETADAAPVPAVTGPGNVVVRATEDAWVQVRSGDQLLLSRLLRKGDTYEVPDGDGLVLMTGNAGGTRIEIDGAMLPPLGGAGEVRRGIPLDAEALRRTFANPT